MTKSQETKEKVETDPEKSLLSWITPSGENQL